MPPRFRQKKPQIIIDEAIVRYGAEIIVRQLAPEELPFFLEISDAYFADPEPVLNGDSSDDGPLRFGAADLVNLLSVVALMVMSATVEHTVSETLKNVKPSVVPAVLRRLFGGEKAADEEHCGATAFESEPRPSPELREPSDLRVSLTPEQLARVRGVAIEAALRQGLPAEKAEVMANAVVAMLLPGATQSAGQGEGVGGGSGSGTGNRLVDGPGCAAPGRPDGESADDGEDS